MRLRWVGRQLWAECEITVSGDATAIEAHQVTVSAQHGLLHGLPLLSGRPWSHADPQPAQGTDPHAVLGRHCHTAAHSPGTGS